MLIEKNFALRGFVPLDLNDVTMINRICLPENYAPSFFMETYRSCPEAFMVAEADRRIVGYIMCRIEHGFSEIRRFRLARKGHIISVAVLPEYRRMGIGYTLVKEACEALARLNAEECYLEVRTTNEPAISLYRKLGFEVSRQIPHYYMDGASAYVMSALLPLSLPAALW